MCVAGAPLVLLLDVRRDAAAGTGPEVFELSCTLYIVRYTNLRA